MHADEAFDDLVHFEVPLGADLLCERLQVDRVAWVDARDEGPLVAASLHAEPADLASLLRTVEAWALERRLSHVRFELDGRTYTLSP